MKKLEVKKISQEELLEILKRFDSEGNVTEEDLASIICEDSIKIKSLKNISKNMKVIIDDNAGNYILIEIINNSSILLKEIIDLDDFPFEESSKFFDSISFVTWFNSLEEEVYALSNDHNITAIKFKSSTKLELSLPIKCKTIQEGYEKLTEMLEKIEDNSTKKTLNCVQRYDLKNAIDK